MADVFMITWLSILYILVGAGGVMLGPVPSSKIGRIAALLLWPLLFLRFIVVELMGGILWWIWYGGSKKIAHPVEPVADEDICCGNRCHGCQPSDTDPKQ